jgi:hypothetical protein
MSGWAPRMGTVFAMVKDNTGMPLAEVERLLDADKFETRLVAVSILDVKDRGKGADRIARDPGGSAVRRIRLWTRVQ